MITWMRKQSFQFQAGLIFGVNFFIGGACEVFALKTRAYDIIISNKTERRYEIDKTVYALRQDIEKWAQEDAEIAARRKQLEMGTE